MITDRSLLNVIWSIMDLDWMWYDHWWVMLILIECDLITALSVLIVIESDIFYDQWWWILLAFGLCWWAIKLWKKLTGLTVKFTRKYLNYFNTGPSTFENSIPPNYMTLVSRMAPNWLTWRSPSSDDVTECSDVCQQNEVIMDDPVCGCGRSWIEIRRHVLPRPVPSNVFTLDGCLAPNYDCLRYYPTKCTHIPGNCIYILL